MSKIENIIAAVVLTSIMVLPGCRDEKELYVIDQTTPVKISSLYMFGNANYTEWSQENPTPLKQSVENAYVFVYHGPLMEGEFKLGTMTGSSYQPYIHPVEDREAIGEETVTDKAFQVPRYGGKDEVWHVGKEGVYKLSFNIQERTYSSVYEGTIDDWNGPIEAAGLYIVGTSNNVGWNLGTAEEMRRDSSDPYKYTWTGNLMPGSLRFMLSNITWLYPAIRPAVDLQPIGQKTPLADEPFKLGNSLDSNWIVEEMGNYTITVNLRERTVSTVFNQTCDRQPVDSEVQVFLYGDATPAGWTLGDGVELTLVEGSDYVYTWEGWLRPGWVLFMLDNFSWEKRIRPTIANSPINADPVVDQKFFFPNPADNNWLVEVAGDYRLTVDLRRCTLSAEFILPPVEELFVYGDASAAGWNLGEGLVMTPVDGRDQVFTWYGPLHPGWLLFSLDNNAWDKTIRPLIANEPIGREPIVSKKFKYPLPLDQNWLVTLAGNYLLTVDIPNRTMSAEMTIEPIEADHIYMSGTSFPSGWNLSRAIEMQRSPSDRYIFTWEGNLNTGSLLFTTDNLGFSNAIRPPKFNIPINHKNLDGQIFEYQSSSSTNWSVKKAGRYRLTVNLRNQTLSTKYISE